MKPQKCGSTGIIESTRNEEVLGMIGNTKKLLPTITKKPVFLSNEESTLGECNIYRMRRREENEMKAVCQF